MGWWGGVVGGVVCEEVGGVVGEVVGGMGFVGGCTDRSQRVGLQHSTLLAESRQNVNI